MGRESVFKVTKFEVKFLACTAAFALVGKAIYEHAPYNWNAREVIDYLTGGATIVALLAFVYSLWKDWSSKKDRSQELLVEHCKSSLEWAYGALMPDSSVTVPPASRLNWLTSARHILNYQKLKLEITREPYITLLRDFEELWRHKFYLVLDGRELVSPHYWGDNDNKLDKVKIEFRSAAVVISFSKWPEGTVDPIDDVQLNDLIENSNFTGRAAAGFKNYKEWVESWREQRKNWRQRKSAEAMPPPHS